MTVKTDEPKDDKGLVAATKDVALAVRELVDLALLEQLTRIADALDRAHPKPAG
jgi:hypothetical protein